jgi:hypothetical protein
MRTPSRTQQRSFTRHPSCLEGSQVVVKQNALDSFVHSQPGALPTEVYENSNYFRDVIFR